MKTLKLNRTLNHTWFVLLLFLMLGLFCGLHVEAASASTIPEPLQKVVEQVKSFFYTLCYLLAFGAFVYAVICLLSGRYPEFSAAFIATILLGVGPAFIEWLFQNLRA